MKLKLNRHQVVLVAVLAFILVIIVGIFIVFRRQTTQTAVFGGNLTVWGVFDSAEVFRNVFEEYQKKFPYVELNYVQKSPATYEAELLNALASPNPPDIFMFHNTWLPKHIDKVVPLLPSVMTYDQFRAFYPEVVLQDFAPSGTIYALPLYIDTLALYYNQDFFDQKGIANPPKNWSEFQRLMPKLRDVNMATSRVNKAGAAIGGSNRSINRMADLMSLLMLQTGTKMISSDFGAATFSSKEGLQALDFYLDFANPGSPYYTWSDAFSYSIDAFAQGDAAMMFNYHYQAKLLKDKNPFLNFRVAPMLQPEGASQALNFANYWGLAVSNKSERPQSAWNFVNSIATDPQVAKKYFELAGHPPAARSLIAGTINDPELGVFSRQALTARTWPQVDDAAIDRAFSRMVEVALSGRPSNQAIKEASETITDLMVARKKRTR